MFVQVFSGARSRHLNERLGLCAQTTQRAEGSRNVRTQNFNRQIMRLTLRAHPTQIPRTKSRTVCQVKKDASLPTQLYYYPSIHTRDHKFSTSIVIVREYHHDKGPLFVLLQNRPQRKPRNDRPKHRSDLTTCCLQNECESQKWIFTLAVCFWLDSSWVQLIAHWRLIFSPFFCNQNRAETTHSRGVQW